MAIAYRSSGTFTAADATTTGAIGLPAGLANGDILILPIHSRGTGNTVTTPAGYTRAAEVNITSGHRLVVFYKYVTNAAGEVAPSVTHSVSALIAGRLSAFSGGNATTQLDVAALVNKHTDLAAVTAKSITPVTPASMVIWVFSSGDNNTLNAATQGTTAYSDDTTTGVDGSLALVYELQGAAVAATGTCRMTQSANGPDNWNTVTLVLRPAATALVDPATDLFDGIDYDVDIAFGASPFTPDPVWTRVTADMLEAPVTIEAGRQGEFSPSAPGTMVGITLANADRKYDPEYAAGPYFGQLNPFTRIRIWARYSAVNYPLFTGYIKAWPQSYIGNLYSSVTLEAIDLFAVLSRVKVPETALTLAVLTDGPYAYFPMFEESGPVCTDRSVNGWVATYGNDVAHTVESFLPGEPGFIAAGIETWSFPEGVGDYYLFTGDGPAVENLRTLEAWFYIGFINTDPSTAVSPRSVLAVQQSATSNQLTLNIVTDSSGFSGFATLTIEAYAFDASTTVGGALIVGLEFNTPYHAVATIDSAYTTHSLYLNGQLFATQSVSAGTFSGGSWGTGISTRVGEDTAVQMAHVAAYEEELTAAQILEHYQAGVSGGLFETAEFRMEQIADFAGLIDAGLYDGTAMSSDTYMGIAQFQGTVLEEMQAVMVAEQGRLFVDGEGILVAQGRAADWGLRLPVNAVSQATFGDDANAFVDELPYATFELEPASVDLTRNVIEVTIGDGNATVRDEESVVQFGPQNETISTTLSSVTDAFNLGLARLRRYAQPTSRVRSMTVDVRDPRLIADGGIALMLAMQLGWRVTAMRRPQGLGDAIEQEMTVEGIVRRFGDGSYIQTMYLVPAHDAYTEHPWFIVGDAVFGLIGAAAGNLVPR